MKKACLLPSLLVAFLAFAFNTSFCSSVESKTKTRRATPTISTPAVDTSARLALIIGNSAYEFSPLKNPVNDASDLASALKDLGFTVILKKNADLRTMDEALEEFGNRLKKGGVGLFFYAGHGVQVQSTNYLIPIGAKVNKESDVKYAALDAGKILDEMAEANNGLNIVVLDACRDNPFGRKFRSASSGLAGISMAPLGTFISYSTGPGKVARDGEARNSPYTSALLETIKKPGLTIEQVFKGVRQKINSATGGQQIPWELSSLQGEFYFNPAKEVKQTAKLDVQGSGEDGRFEKEQMRIGEERRRLEAEKTQLEKDRKRVEQEQKLEEERQKLAEEKKRIEEEKQALAEQKAKKPAVKAIAPRPPQAPVESSKRITNSIGMELVLIPAGSFMMGSPSDESGRDNDETQHQVSISRPYYLQTTEVTQGQWKAIMGNNPSRFLNCGEDCPVEQVSWNDAQEFIRKLNQKENTSRYRLPTEAEWEYAARSGGQKERWAGISNEFEIGAYAWYSINSDGKTHPVGEKRPNGLGLYDMSGNVWEWCQDWYGDYLGGSVTDPIGPTSGQGRVLRGGSWIINARNVRSALRFRNNPDNRFSLSGFRIARDF